MRKQPPIFWLMAYSIWQWRTRSRKRLGFHKKQNGNKSSCWDISWNRLSISCFVVHNICDKPTSQNFKISSQDWSWFDDAGMPGFGGWRVWRKLKRRTTFLEICYRRQRKPRLQPRRILCWTYWFMKWSCIDTFARFPMIFVSRPVACLEVSCEGRARISWWIASMAWLFRRVSSQGTLMSGW